MVVGNSEKQLDFEILTPLSGEHFSCNVCAFTCMIDNDTATNVVVTIIVNSATDKQIVLVLFKSRIFDAYIKSIHNSI